MSVGQPSVTALLPAYNAAAFIDETLQSLAAQTYPNLRVLISVDASTDDTAERCERFARGDARFAVVRQAQRLGWVGNGQDLLRRAESELCFFISHDDVVEPEYVAALVAALAANRRAALAYCDVDVWGPNGERETSTYPEIDGVAPRFDRMRVALARNGGWWTAYRGLFRTDVARRGRPLRHNLAGEFAADWPLLLHFALAGDCVRVPRQLYRKRYRATSVSVVWRYGVLQRVAVGLCCARVVMEAEFTGRERAALLAVLARRVGRDIAVRVRSLARYALRRA
jgi:glycosyltransferase involved in cell wall biosynthesis